MDTPAQRSRNINRAHKAAWSIDGPSRSTGVRIFYLSKAVVVQMSVANFAKRCLGDVDVVHAPYLDALLSEDTRVAWHCDETTAKIPSKMIVCRSPAFQKNTYF